MKSLTIRTRLTVTIVVVTAVISALGVLFGVRLLEGQVREAAIDERAGQVEALGELAFLNEALGLEFEGEDFELLDDSFMIDDDFLGDDDVDAQMIEFTREYVGLVPNLDDVVDQIGTDADELLVWIGTAQVVAVSDSGGRVVPIDQVGSDPIVPISDLLELGLFPEEFEQFDPNLFGGDDPESLDLEIGTREFDGVTVGFIAEVSDELAALDAIRDTLRNVVIALTVLAGLATWFIAGRALRPVGAITEQVGDITSGTLSERVPEPSSQDEIGTLARTMNTMLSRLETSDLRRRQFVSDASHELRTPVAVLRSEAEVARRAPDSTSIDELSSVVLGESKRLEGLVEDLLSLARGDEARMSSATHAVDVDEIVLDEAGRSRSLPVDKRAVSAGRVVGHHDDVQRMIAHLLDNAARHGETTAAVGVQTLGDVVRIWVDDDGPGIDTTERERVFARFVRLDDARTRDAGGAGLGLAVVRETVEAMKGTIEVLDSPLGGARFQIDLPAA